MQQERLLEKIKTLPPELAARVEDFVDSLTSSGQDGDSRAALSDAIAAYAAKHGGTDADLDVELEAASLEHLASTEEAGG